MMSAEFMKIVNFNSTDKQNLVEIVNKQTVKSILEKDLNINLSRYSSTKRLSLYKQFRTAIFNYGPLSKNCKKLNKEKFLNFLLLKMIRILKTIGEPDARSQSTIETSNLSETILINNVSDDSSDIVPGQVLDVEKESKMISHFNINDFVQNNKKFFVSGSSDKLHTLSIKLDGDFIKIFENDIVESIPTFELDSVTILTWPDITIILTLPHIIYKRSVKLNSNKSFIIGEFAEKNSYIDIVKNDISQITKIKSDEPIKEAASHILIKSYVNVFIRFLEILDLPEADSNKVKAFMNILLWDLEKLEMSFVKTTYIYNSSYYKLHRKFNLTHKDSKSKINLLEEINPVVNFQIDATALTENCDEKLLFAYFDDIMKRNSQSDIKNVLLSCISYKCNFCNETFDHDNLKGIIDHVSIHYIPMKEFSCNNCSKIIDQNVLFQNEYLHSCPKNI